MDKETTRINAEQKELQMLIGHQGWTIARNKLTERILELQSIADYADILESGNAEKLMLEMKSNKRASEVLFDWLREIEGTASQAAENIKTPLPSYIKRD